MSALDVRQIGEVGLKKGRAPAVKQELRILIAEKAFDEAVARGEKDGTREVGGVLVGELLRDDAGPFLRVDATIDALHADEKGAELTFTHATWEHINKEMDSTHADRKIVGWYHTHPGFGIFLSDRDEFIHSSFFDQPFQIALVYDPKSREHGVFAWHEGRPTRCRRYWIGEREHTWDGTRAAEKKEEAPAEAAGGSPSKAPRPKDAEAKTAARDQDERPGDWKSMLATGALMALIGAVGGFWIGTREARAVLQQVELELSKARAEGVRAAVQDIDAQLLGVLRATLGNEATRRPLEQALVDLDEAEKTFADAPSYDSVEHRAGLARIEAARDRLRQIRDDRGDAHAVLARLEEISRQSSLSPAEISRELATMRATLGALHSEMASDAARAGDLARADRLLTAAAGVDNGNRARYEQQRKALGGPAAPAPSASGGRP